MLFTAVALTAIVAATAAGPASLRGVAQAQNSTNTSGPVAEKESVWLSAEEPFNLSGETGNGTNASEAIAERESARANASGEGGVVLNGSSVSGAIQPLQLASAGRCPHSDQINDPSRTCAAGVNYGCAGCYLYRVCHSRSYCIIGGHLVVPGTPLRGMEDINGGDAGRWDYLWDVARRHCGSDGCVLLSNPIHHRTQHQMHIHFRHYNSGGRALKHRLERALCGTRGWRYFRECGSAKARLYDRMPGVFSVVDRAYGGGSLANVGITVWFTDACGGGQKIMILATTHCSIEHRVSAR